MRRRGMVDNGQIPIVSNDRNYCIIVSNQELTPGYIDNNGNVTQLNNNWFIDRLLPIRTIAFLTGENPKLSFVSSKGVTKRFAFYDENGLFISRSYINTGTDDFVTPSAPSNAKYCKLGWAGNNPTYIIGTEPVNNSAYNILGYYGDNGVIEPGGTTQYSTDKIQIPDGYKSFAITPYGIANNVNSRVAFFDQNGEYISRYFYFYGKTISTFTGSIPTNASYYSMTKAPANDGYDMLADII